MFQIARVTVTGFTNFMEMKDSVWSVSFYRFHTKDGGLVTPTSPSDFGENIVFKDCFIADAPAGTKFQLNRGEYVCHGGSFDNIEVETNNDASPDRDWETVLKYNIFSEIRR